MDINEIKQMYDQYILPTYMRQDLCLVKGKGAWVEDSEGKKYLDLFPGWGVSGTGHRHPVVVKRMKEAMSKILHVSNNFYNEYQPVLAKKIIETSFPGKVFFSNSGAEANEGAVKIARKFGNPSRNEIITMEMSFHGRTLAMITATGQEKVRVGFDPIPQGFKYVPFNDINALRASVNEKTIAIMLEPVQGEGGINIAEKAYMKAVRELCDEKDILLIVDEVQTGMGRTGEMFAYQHYDIVPDIMTLSKSLGGGAPIGAVVAGAKVKDIFTPGSHGTTFGGSPVVCAAALGVFEAIEKEGLLENTIQMGKYFTDKLEALKKKRPVIKKIKALGLMIGVELDREDATNIFKECLKEGLLINCTQKNILRMLPPMTITKKDVDKAIKRLSKALERI